MFEFIEKNVMFLGLLSFCTTISFCESLAFNSKGTIKCLSLNTMNHVKLDKHLLVRTLMEIFFPFTTSVNKCGGSCNTIDDLYGRVCVPKKQKIWLQKYI